MLFHRPAYLVAASAVLALSACGPPASEDENGGIEQQEQVMPVEPDGGIGDGAPPLAEAGSGIPMIFRGSWGMNAADCAGGAAAKGLLEIDADTVTFYESVGTLGETVSVKPGSLQAVFAFEGEGMEWTREMQLETANDGTELLRRELGDGAMPGEFRYRKCS